MIQDIEPSRLDNAYKPYNPDEEDPILLFDENGRLCVYDQDGKIRFTTGKEIPTAGSVYLFSVDDVRYFLASEGIQKDLPGYTYKSIRELRNVDQSKEIFAAFTAYHLWR